VIAVSIIGVTVATVLLVVGLIRGATALLVSSIAVSVAAAVALLLGVRRLPAARVPEVDRGIGLAPRPVGRAAVPVQAPPPEPEGEPQSTPQAEATPQADAALQAGAALQAEGVLEAEGALQAEGVAAGQGGAAAEPGPSPTASGPEASSDDRARDTSADER